jgi:hypothetical protein
MPLLSCPCTCMLASTESVLRPREQAHALRLNNPDHLKFRPHHSRCVLQKSSLAKSYTDRFLVSCLVLVLVFVLPSIPQLDISCTKISSATTRELTRPRSCVQQKETPASGAISGIACMYCEYVVVVNNGRVFLTYEPVCTCVM